MKKFWIIAVIIVAFLLVILYAGSANPEQDLYKTYWVLTSLNGNNPLPGTTITARFEPDKSVEGSGGCNGYSAVFLTDGDSLSIVGEIISTRMSCEEPVNEQESLYFQALKDAASFKINNEELTLLNSKGDVLTVYQAQSQSLDGTSWNVKSYNNGTGAVTSLIIDTEMTANFGKDGFLTGSSGCNTYSAAYTSENGKITIEPPAATLKFCTEPEGVMEQEGKYLAALETAATYEIKGDSMGIQAADGSTVANFGITLGQ
jgi:heat shock protein HslJ